MIRREMVKDADGTPLIRVQGALRIELHDMGGTIVDGWEPTPDEKAEHTAWAAGRPPGLSERLTRTVDVESTGRHIL